MKKKRIWWVIGAVVVLAAIGVASTRGDKGTQVQVATVGRLDIQAKVSANGKVQAVKKVEITANVMGQVTHLAVKEGDAVKAGDFLLEIDPVRSKAAVQGIEASVQAALQDAAQAKARLQQARNDLERAEANLKAEIISSADFEQVRTAVVTAEASYQASQRRVDGSRADLAQARDNLSKTTIKAPMDGIVTARRIEQGETAVIGLQNQPGTVLLTISDMSKVEGEMEVDEASIPNVKLGQSAQVRIDAYPNQTFEGVVTEVGGSPLLKTANEATKFKVKVWIKNPPDTIKPGLSAQADIFTGKRDQAIALPIQALVMKEKKGEGGQAPTDEEGVYVVESGKAKFVAVKTGLMGELNVEVTSGLKGGETVITGPFKVLRDFKGGEQVRITKPPEKDKDKA
jgi:HlyD family secretion protein